VDYSSLSPQALVLACADTGDELAWQEFIRRFHRLIAAVVLRTAHRWGEMSPQIVDELIQETYLKFCADKCRLLRSFHSTQDDAIYGYVKVVTANLVHDHFKASRAEKRGGSVVTAPIDVDPQARCVWNPEPSTADVERKVLIQQVAACLDKVTSGPNAERDRRVFWLYYRTGLSASAIAALPATGLATKGVESTLLRLTRLVRQRLAGHERADAASKSAKGIRAAESL
jgi:RNA polymerase sigma-70 factor (ECF subfamily)